MKDTNPVGHRVSTRRKALGLSQAVLADMVGMTQSGIAEIEKGNVKRPGRLVELARALKTTPQWITTGELPPGYEAEHEIDRQIDPDYEARPANGILEIDVRAGLGAGGTTEGREVRHDGNHADPVKAEAWHFPARFMREELRAPESRVIILETDGDSMYPTIGSGERVIVDTGLRVPSPDGIFALRDSFGNIVAKRLQVLRGQNPPRVMIISDNKSHAPEEVGVDEIEIVGRVLWCLKRV